MNYFKINKFYSYSADYIFIQKYFYASKNYWELLKKDSEIHQLRSENSRPRKNLLAVFGFAGTGALGIKRMINNERKTGNLINARKPYPFYYFNSAQIFIKDVACGYGFTLFSGRSKSNCDIYGCGINNDSQIGLQDVPFNNQKDQIVIEPTVLKMPVKMKNVSHISCGRAHSIIAGEVSSADEDNQVIYSLGNNSYGQCGREIIDKEVFSNNSIIHRINFSKRVVQIECGELNTYFLTEDGKVYGCGSNMYGQVSEERIERCSTPLKIQGLDGEVVKQISSRFNTVLALTEKGEVWAWGNNDHGLVFPESINTAVHTPKRLPMPLTAGKIVHVSAGNTVCAVVDEFGKVFTWGQFLLGLGPSCEMSMEPRMIPEGLFGGGLNALDKNRSKVVSVHCGSKYCLVVTSSGSLYFWGEGGAIKTGSQTFPVMMPLVFNAKRVFSGADHSVIMGRVDF